MDDAMMKKLEKIRDLANECLDCNRASDRPKKEEKGSEKGLEGLLVMVGGKKGKKK